MKKLTAGILTVMLGIVSANSADAAVASKRYVDTKADAAAAAAAAAAQSAAESTAASALAGAKSELEGKINAKVAQSDYNTKIGQLEQADTNISNLVGTLPADAGVNNVVAYIDQKTTGIASDAKLTELSGKVTENTGAIATLNGDANTTGSVAKQIADSISELNLANTYDAKGAAATAEQNAKDYTDQQVAAGVSELGDEVSGLLGEGFSTESTVASQLGAVKTTADAAKLSVKNVKEAFEEFKAGPVGVINMTLDTLNGDASTAGSVAYAVNAGKAQAIEEAKSDAASQISKLNLNELSRVPAECGVDGKYCVLTSDGTNYLWEVIERATDEVQETGTPIPSVIPNPADK